MKLSAVVSVSWAVLCLGVVVFIDPLAGAVLSLDGILIGIMDRIL